MQAPTKPQRAKRFKKKEYNPSWPLVNLVAWCEKRKCSLAQSHEAQRFTKKEYNPSWPLVYLVAWCEKRNADSHKATKGTKINKEKIQPFVALCVLCVFVLKKKCSLTQNHEGHKNFLRNNTTLCGPLCTWLLGVKKENAVSHKATKGTKIHKERIHPLVALRVLGYLA